MKIKEVPQDDAGFLIEGKVRDVCYAVDDDGNYTQVLSLGWDPKNEAMRQAWEQVHEKAEKVRQKVLAGKLSPIAFHMERCMMTVTLLAQYTGIGKLKVKKHLKPSGYEKLTKEELALYAEAFNITIEQIAIV
jgi:hypothetical protein